MNDATAKVTIEEIGRLLQKADEAQINLIQAFLIGYLEERHRTSYKGETKL